MSKVSLLTCEVTALSVQAGLWNSNENKELNFKEIFSVCHNNIAQLL